MKDGHNFPSRQLHFAELIADKSHQLFEFVEILVFLLFPQVPRDTESTLISHGIQSRL